MKVKILKTGRYAHPIVSQPQVDLKEGMVTVVDEVMAEALIKTGWAEDVKSKPKPEKTKSEPNKETKTIGEKIKNKLAGKS